jgi:2-keto-4-pentenoate hydratase
MTRPAADAAAILWKRWQDLTRIDELPSECRPLSRADGYAVQAELARLSGQQVAGWKIAATSAAGQRHIAVDGPLAGRLLAGRQVPQGCAISLDGNLMRVAEAEFAFRLARPLPKRTAPFSVEEVLDAVGSLHPAIEVPDSRYNDFVRVGGSQLIADMACASWFMVGAAAPDTWRTLDLATHRVVAHRNGESAGDGGGFNVLGDPRVALTWIANELRVFADGLLEGQVVITGTCITPIAIAPGDRVLMDFGGLGSINAAFSG